MPSSLKKLMARLRRAQEGFTLVELLVVVGIIVAVAAVTVPSVLQFTGKGDQGAKATEEETVQTAMDSMMADKSINAVTGLTSAQNSNNVWTSLPGGTGAAALTTYMRNNTTVYFYCYDATGKVTRQDAAAAACP